MTSADGGGRPTVVYVGSDPPADDRLDLRRASDPDGASLDGVDCVVVGPDADPETLAAVDAPTVVYDPAGDPALAARASRLGVAEYVTDAALDGESLADRIVANAASTPVDALRRYRAVLEAHEGMVLVVGRDARIELATASLAERFGYDRADLVGRSARAFVGDEFLERGYEALERLQDGEDSVAVETTATTADGEPVPVEVDLSVLSTDSEFEGLVGVVRDRTDLERTRTELRDERDRFQQLFDQLPDAIVDTEFVDGEPIVRGVNPAFEETFGYDEASIVGESVNDVIVPPEYQREARSLDDTAMQEGAEMAEVERETADGRRTFLFRGFVYRTEGETDRGFGIYTDVTERLEQERRLRVLHRVLRHNLRNEMTAVRGFADLLVERTEGETREYAERVRERAGEVATLGKQVQRIERALDEDSRRRAPVDPVAVAERVVERFRERYPEATFRVTAEDPGEAIADELLELAVENLVENALEHAGEAPEVTVEVTRDDGQPDRWLELTVRDDGPGIPERERAVVSGEQTITQLNHSKGLGLWITRWIAEGVGGRLSFGDDGEGAAVTIRLQRLAEEPPA